MTTIAIFTVTLFAFVIWHGATTPAAAEPTATVTGTKTLPGGDVKVTVQVRTVQKIGLVKATVEVDCDTPRRSSPSSIFRRMAGGRTIYSARRGPRIRPPVSTRTEA